MKKNAKILVYSTSTCPYCVEVKDYLDAKKIKYSEIDIENNEKKAQEMVKKSGQMGVPVVIIQKNGKENIIVGFEKDEIDQLIGLTS